MNSFTDFLTSFGTCFWDCFTLVFSNYIGVFCFVCALIGIVFSVIYNFAGKGY